MTSTDIHIQNLRKKGIHVQKVISKTLGLASGYSNKEKTKPRQRNNPEGPCQT